MRSSQKITYEVILGPSLITGLLSPLDLVPARVDDVAVRGWRSSPIATVERS